MLTNIKTYADESTEFMDALKTILTESLDAESFSPDIYISEPEELECRSRDGFIPHSWNKGGVMVSGFTNLGQILGSGYYPRSKVGRKFVAKEIEHTQKLILEDFVDQYSGELASLDKDKLELEDLPPRLEDAFFEMENELLSNDYASVMVYAQAMYEGRDISGKHKLYVTAAINLDAPYHRTGRMEVDASDFITFSTLAELETKLPKKIAELAAKAF